MSETKNWEDMSDDELLGLHHQGKLPQEAVRAIGAERLRMVSAWDGVLGGERPELRVEVEVQGPNYEAMTNDDLRSLLRGRPGDLSLDGNKAKLIKRLQASDTAAAEAEAEADDDEDDENDDDSENEDSPEDETSNKGAGKAEDNTEPKSKDKGKSKDKK